jgi:flagellar protein FliO/FliZ
MEDLLIAVRAIVSLAAVLGLLLWMTHHVKKRQTTGGSSRTSLPGTLKKLTALLPARPEAARSGAARRESRPEKITVVARSGLSGKAQLVVAEFGGIRYVLGVTEHGVSVVDTQETSPAWDLPLTDIADIDAGDGAARADDGGSALKSVA